VRWNRNGEGNRVYIVRERGEKLIGRFFPRRRVSGSSVGFELELFARLLVTFAEELVRVKLSIRKLYGNVMVVSCDLWVFES